MAVGPRLIYGTSILLGQPSQLETLRTAVKSDILLIKLKCGELITYSTEKTEACLAGR